MAALQSIRKHGKLLMIVIGLGLFAFIAEAAFQSINYLVSGSKTTVGRVFGEKLAYNDYIQMIDQMTDAVKMQRAAQGQGGELSEEETMQLRDQVWGNFISYNIIKHEADEFGLTVTDGEISNALNEGTAGSLQLLASVTGFRTAQGTFDVKALNEFLQQKDQLINQYAQQNPEAAEQVERIYKLWLFCKERLGEELLRAKYYTLLSQSFISNPIAAKMNFEDRTKTSNVQIAAIPYATVADKDVQVTEADLQKAYDEDKERFVLPTDARSVKYIDVEVAASAPDRAALQKDMNEAYARLQSTDSVAPVMAGSRTLFPYVNLAMSKKVFASMPDVAKNLDSMAVGATKAPYYNAQDNTMTTMKLIARTQAPDSVLYRFIGAPAADAAKSKTTADSILNALNGGADFKAIAKKYGQTGDSVWLTSDQYESNQLPAQMVGFITKLTNLGVNQKTVLDNNGTSVVVEVLERKGMVTKYNAAIVRREVSFSSKTYSSELSKLNKFLGENKTIEAFEKNAAKNGYIVRTVDVLEPTSGMAFANNIGGENARAALRWVFDEADENEISQLFECGRKNNHLLVMAVTAKLSHGYLPLSNKSVRDFLTTQVKKEKKAALLAERLKNVKNFAQARSQKGAVVESLQGVTFLGNVQLSAIGVPEAALNGAIARTAAGKSTGLVKGAAAVYFVQVDSKAAGTEKYNAAAEMQQIAGQGFNFIYSQSFYGPQESLLQELQQRTAKVEDRRYAF